MTFVNDREKANALATQKIVQFAAIGWIVTAKVCDVSIDELILAAEGMMIQTASNIEGPQASHIRA
jgi:hypothetical protein